MNGCRAWWVCGTLALLAIATGCRSKESAADAAAPVEASSSGVAVSEASGAVSGDGGAAACELDSWARDVLDLGKRAQAGESVVAAGGCSLFDGKLLARGFPTTEAQARAALTADAACAPTLTAQNAQLKLTRVDGKVMVASARNTAAQGDAQAVPEGADWESSLMRAARCPAPEHRLKTEQDASVAMAYAVAMDALQASLEESVGKGTGPSEKARTSLVKVCEKVKKFPPVQDAAAARARGEKAVPVAKEGNADLEPLAATALLMAGSFTVFGQAAKTFKMEDAGLAAVKGSALGVVASPPKTSLEGVCAMWTMADDMHKNLQKPPKGKAKPKRSSK